MSDCHSDTYAADPSLVLAGHDRKVISVDWTTDGNRLVSGGQDNTVRGWDASSGRLLFSVAPFADGTLISVRLSPCGDVIVCGSSNGRVRLMDAHTGRRMRHDIALAGMNADWSPDGSRLATCGMSDEVNIADVGSRRILATFVGYRRMGTALAWSRDGGLLVVGSNDGVVRVLDVRGVVDGDAPVVFARDSCLVTALTGHSKGVRSLCWSPDGKLLACCDRGIDGVIRLWHLATRSVFMEMQCKGEVLCLRWSHDGRMLASGGQDRVVRVWDVSSGRELLALAGHAYTVTCVSWSPDDSTLASGSGDRRIHVWERSSVTWIRRAHVLRGVVRASITHCKFPGTSSWTVTNCPHSAAGSCSCGDLVAKSSAAELDDAVRRTCAHPASLSSAPAADPAGTYVCACVPCTDDVIRGLLCDVRLCGAMGIRSGHTATSALLLGVVCFL